MLPEFKDQELLNRALTHTSYANEHVAEGGVPMEDNERLEFLGDAVLDFVAAKWLFHRFPDLNEGRLTSLRAALVRASTLAQFAESIHLSDHLLLGKGETDSGGRHRSNILSDTFEALMGALYLDQGVDAVCVYFEQMLERVVSVVLNENLDRDPKSQLQEWSQAHLAVTPRYKTVNAEGPDHAKTFTVEVWLGDRVAALGTGSSKQAAEQAAARTALSSLAASEGPDSTPTSENDSGDAHALDHKESPIA